MKIKPALQTTAGIVALTGLAAMQEKPVQHAVMKGAEKVASMLGGQRGVNGLHSAVNWMCNFGKPEGWREQCAARQQQEGK